LLPTYSSPTTQPSELHVHPYRFPILSITTSQRSRLLDAIYHIDSTTDDYDQNQAQVGGVRQEATVGLLLSTRPGIHIDAFP